MNLDSFLVTVGPLILAALGGLLSEWAGLLNIGLEGFMLLGAFLAVAGAHACGNWLLGLCLGFSLALFGGLLLGGLMTWTAIDRRANIFIVGLAINLLASSLVSFGGSWLFQSRSVVALAENQLVPTWIIAILGGVGSIAMAVLLWWFSRSTRTGLRLRVLGSDAPMLVARGIDTQGLSRSAILFSAVFASLSGALLSLQLGAFVPNQSAGKGWIALVLVFVGGRHPLGIALACAAYVILEQVSVKAQAGLQHPALLVGLPFLLVFGGLLLVSTAQNLAKGRRH